MSTIEKPCIRKCALNENEICTGCYRTFDEMRLWHKSTDIEKKKILQKAKLRQVKT